MNEQPIFENLKLIGWRQFQEIDLELHRRLTILTGANGSGKSSLLNILSLHYGWHRPFLGVPHSSSGLLSYLTGAFDTLKKFLNFATDNINEKQIGKITYSNNASADITVPTQIGGNIQFGINILNQQTVVGLHVPSHRQMPTYQRIPTIPTDVITPEAAYGNFSNELMTRYQGATSSYSPTYRLKEALISMAIFGAGNQYVAPNELALRTFLGFQEILRKILPEALGFEELLIRNPDVLLRTRTGQFVLESASGGIIAIIDLAWQIYLFSIGKTAFVVTIDEPENHLHPAMQRSLLSKLLDAFPNAQFIIATHSPFMVTAVRDSNVYVLGYRQTDFGEEAPIIPQERSVTSTKLDTVNKAGTASEILREVLGVPTTFPEWVENDLARIIDSYRAKNFDTNTLASLRQELESTGLGELYPKAISELVRRD